MVMARRDMEVNAYMLPACGCFKIFCIRCNIRVKFDPSLFVFVRHFRAGPHVDGFQVRVDGAEEVHLRPHGEERAAEAGPRPLGLAQGGDGLFAAFGLLGCVRGREPVGHVVDGHAVAVAHFFERQGDAVAGFDLLDGGVVGADQLGDVLGEQDGLLPEYLTQVFELRLRIHPVSVP